MTRKKKPLAQVKPMKPTPAAAPAAPPTEAPPSLPGTPQPAQQTIKLHGISQPLMGRVLKALRSCPYDDVADLIPELVNAPLFDWSPGPRG